MIIGFAGQMGSGKDEAAQRVKRLLPNTGVVRVSFAEKMKKSAAALFNLDESFWESNKRNDFAFIEVTTLHAGGIGHIHSKMTVREMLQRYGTEAHREVFGNSFWVDAALPLGLDHSDIVVTVTDTRFPEEIQRVKDMGGIIVRLNDGEPSEPTHASEQILSDDLIDYEVDNSVRDDNFYSLDTQLLAILEKKGLTNGVDTRADLISN